MISHEKSYDHRILPAAVETEDKRVARNLLQLIEQRRWLSFPNMNHTCTVANAIERLGIRPRNEGFIVGAVRCQYPKLPPVAGHAVTGRIHSSMPPVGGGW